MTKLTSQDKVRLLTTASAAIAAVALCAPAIAGNTVVTPTSPTTASQIVSDAQDNLASDQNNTGGVNVDADVAGNTIGEAGVATTNDTLTVTVNSITANAFGNNFDNEIAPFNGIENSFPGDGAASLGLQINTNTITADADGNAIGIDVVDFTTGTAEVSGNSIGANANGNAGTTLLSGSVPNTYASTTAGSSTISFGTQPDWLDAEGSLTASTVQVNGAASVSAQVGDGASNIIGIGLDASADNDVDANPTLDSNRITAAASGNNSNSTIEILSGANPLFNGSAVLTNAQLNSGIASEVQASNAGSEILADIEASGGSVNNLIGGVSVTDNTISSSATGNAALGNGAAGNRIVLGDTMSFQGLAGTDADGYIFYANGALEQGVDADVVISSSQGNVGASNGTRMNVNAATTGSTIAADVEDVDDGSVTVAGNASTATARGNDASSAFATGSGVNSFDGTVAVANQQTNTYVDVAALNAQSLIGADVTHSDDDDLDDSTVSVTGNSVSATASLNRSSQSIDLAAASTSATGSTGTVDLSGGIGPDGHLEGTGAAVAMNLQSGYSSSVTANQTESAVGVTTNAEDIDDSTVVVASNTQEASARGSTGANSVSLSGNSVAGGVGAVNIQILADDFSVTAISSLSEAGIYSDDDSDESTLQVQGNRQAATAYGNSVSQSVSVEANAIDLNASGVSMHGGTDPDGADDNVSVDANVGLASLQAIDGSDAQSISASVSGNEIYIDLDDVDDSTLAVTSTAGGARNVQEAVAVGNSGTNAVSLAGTSVGTGAGLASVQIADGVAISATNAGSTVGIYADDIDNSTVEVGDNLQRAIAYGGSVANTLSVAATNIEVDGGITGGSTVNYDAGNPEGFVLDGAAGSQPEVLAAYGLLNVQTVHATITAEMLGEDAIEVDVGPVNTSTILNEGNDFVAAAYGSDAVNAASLTGNGNVDSSTGGYASVMNITNAQTLVANGNYDSEVVARAAGTAGSGVVVRTEIDGNIEDSTASTSGNAIQAQAIGNQAGNTLAARVNNVDTETDGSFTQGSGSVVGGQASVDASFSVNNVQAASGVITATLWDGTDATSASVLTQIDGSVIDSSVHSDGNSLSAAATANRADNLIDLAGNQLATATALVNYQIDPTTLTAQVGIAGGVQNVLVPGTGVDAVVVNQPFNYTTSKSNTGCSDGTCNNVTVTRTIDTSGLTPAQIAAITGNGEGWVDGGEDTLVLVDNQGTQTDVYYTNLSTSPGTTNADVETSPAIPAEYTDVYVPGSGGVTVAIGGMVDPSLVTVNANSTSGSVTGNSANNTIKVAASHLPDGNDHIFTSATADGIDTDASGDHSLANVQIVTEGGSLDSQVNGTFAIDMNDGELLLDSTLEVDGNVQTSRAVANTATNSITLDVGNTEAGASLASNQSSDAPVSATSNLDVFAPVASDNSSVSMSNNSNLAVGVINNVSNTVTVDAGNATFITAPNSALVDVDSGGGFGDTVALGDHVLLNKQAATTTVSSTAATNIYNDDNTALTSEGINNGSVKIVGNSTTAEASANRASNTMNVSATNLSASAGLVNNQSSSAAATASATTDAGISLAGDQTLNAAAINGSTATLGQNSTSALARGNSASNVLNYSAGANYGIGGFTVAGVSTDQLTPNATANAQAAVLNVQDNSGAVSASSTNGSYLVALNSTGTATATNATIGVIGNSVAAAAYGNTANNAINVAAVNGNMPTVALGNQQRNTANVTATVSFTQMGITSGVGAATGSTLGVSGNAITATAVGNNAVNSIAAGR
jgi:hypothetical protein